MQRSIRRRRHEAKTDYKARLSLIQSGKPRLVVRKTNQYLIAQIVTTSIAQDTIRTGITSKALLAHGWPEAAKGSLKSAPAAYLTGLLLGTNVKKTTPEVILDIGMHRNIQKSRIYALVAGVLAAGVKLPHDAAILPTPETLEKNKKLHDIFTTVRKKLHG